MQYIAVKPSNYREIFSVVDSFKQLLESHDDTLFVNDYCDIVGVYNLLMGLAPDSFQFDCIPVVDWPDLSIEGRTKIDGKVLIREDVYLNACDNVCRDRFTLAHELAHWVMHRDTSFHREKPSHQKIKTFEDPEWQAEAFAGFLLIPTKTIRMFESSGVTYIEKVCCVSNAAVKARRRVFISHNL